MTRGPGGGARMPRLSIIAAMSLDRVIGVGNRLPWRLPADLRRFKRLTLGKWMVLGRRTLDSIGGPLPGRQHVVLSRDPAYAAPGCRVAHGLDQALQVVAEEGSDEAMIIGGAQVYAQALPRADRLLLTLVATHVAGDARFPPWEGLGLRLVHEDVHAPDAENPLATRFLVLERPGLVAPGWEPA